MIFNHNSLIHVKYIVIIQLKQIKFYIEGILTFQAQTI